MYAADLHIHSKYSRATSADCVPAMLNLWARRKGISLLGTGDFTHPAWRQMLNDQLIPSGDGVYALREEFSAPDSFAPPQAADARFIVSGEISSIYKQGGRVRKVHSLILLPSLESTEALSKKLEAIGNIHSDGRPILGLSAHDLLDMTLTVCPEAIFIPAHIWTPHFSLFGAFSGFDTIEECFSDLTGHIHALETGLSSDPEMNRRVSALDRYTLVSNSDAHSPARLGRELNLLEGEISYPALKRALEEGTAGGFAGTVEFFPEEGKYHFDGHRACAVCLPPEEAAARGNLCPVCGKRLTTGVYHRVLQLADRPEGCPPPTGSAPFERLIPLAEVIASVSGVSASSARAQARCEALVHALGSEVQILRELPIEEIRRAAGEAVAEGIARMRRGEVNLEPGFDGEYGKIGLMTPDEIRALSGQMTFLDALLPEKPKKRAATLPLPEKNGAEEQPAPALQGPSPSAGLNERQREAVESSGQVTAVIAGPGSGKTKTLIARIAHLIEQGVKPEEIAAVTFTNRSAGEMRDRLTRHFGSAKAIRGMHIGTFHSICLSLLRRSRPALSVLDEAGALSLAGEIIGGTALNITPARFLAEIEKSRRGESCELSEEILALWKARLDAMDAACFDDLLTGELADPLPLPFAHLLVDEYQDINERQRALIDRWSESCRTLFVIGDPDQSIYGFRGADAACFDRLLHDRPDAALVSLNVNYRSAPEILAASLPLIGQDGRRRDLTAGRESGGTVRRIDVADEYHEAVVLAKEIGRMVGGMDMLNAQTEPERSVGFSDIAVLYRTHRQADMLEKCLAKEGIPYVVSGREDWLAAPSVVRAVHFFRLALQPGDQAALHALLPGIKEIGPTGESTEALCAYLEPMGGEYASLSEKLRAYAPRAQKEKPAKLLTRYRKDMSAGSDEGFAHLLSAAAAYEKMQDFLNDLTLGAEADVSRAGGKTWNPQSVRLMTLHASKGLEFPVVFLAGVRQGMLPMETPHGRPTDREEERRLMYIGMTRAKDELILLTGPAPSAFLKDIPPETMTRTEPLYRPKPAAVQLSLFSDLI